MTQLIFILRDRKGGQVGHEFQRFINLLIKDCHQVLALSAIKKPTAKSGRPKALSLNPNSVLTQGFFQFFNFIFSICLAKSKRTLV